jgi:hypothetical protein
MERQTGPAPTTDGVTVTPTTEPPATSETRSLRRQPTGGPTRAGASSDHMATTMWRAVAPVITSPDINTVQPTGDEHSCGPELLLQIINSPW